MPPGGKKAKKKAIQPQPKPRPKKRSKKVEAALSKLTMKERQLLESRMSGLSKTESAIGVYGIAGDPRDRDTRKKAHKIAATVLRRPNVKEALDALLSEHNLALSRILDVIDAGLSATKVVAVVRIPAPKTGEESQSGNELQEVGMEADNYVEIPDHKTRHAFAETALALHGLPDKSKEGGSGELTYAERMKAIWNRIEKQMAVDTTAVGVR